MQKNISVTALILIAFFILSCVATKTATKLPLTGSPQSPEWKEYNNQAKTKDGPQLTYLVTCKELVKINSSRKPEKVTDLFSKNDKFFHVYRSWTNVQGKHISGIKIYDPRGMLYRESEITFSFKGPGWNIYSTLPIRKSAASRLPGKWKAEIFMDGELAAIKEFIIESADIELKQISWDKNTPSIGVIKFIPKGGAAKRFDYEMPEFIERMLSVDYPNYRKVGVWEINKSINIPPTIELKNYIPELLNSDMFAELVNKHKIKLFIAGSAYDGGMYNEDKIFKIYIIDAKSKTIAKQLTIRWSSSHYGVGADSSYEITINSCNKVYKTIIAEAKHEIESILHQK